MNVKALKDDFSAVWSQYVLSQKQIQENHLEKNKQFATEVLSRFENLDLSGGRINIYPQFVEFVSGGQSPSLTINFEDKSFLTKVKAQLSKLKIQLT